MSQQMSFKSSQRTISNSYTPIKLEVVGTYDLPKLNQENSTEI
jgi:hypothetical protein